MTALRITNWILIVCASLGVVGSFLVYQDASGRGFDAVAAVAVVVLLPPVAVAVGELLALPFTLTGLITGIRAKHGPTIAIAAFHLAVGVGVVATIVSLTR